MSEQPKPITVNLDLDEYFRGEPVTQIVDEVVTEFLTQRNATIVDLAAIREQRDWSDLKDKVVGAEGA